MVAEWRSMISIIFEVVAMTMMSLVEVVDEDDETKTGHHQNEVWGEEGQTGPIQKRKGPSKIIFIYNLSFNLTIKDHC